MDSHLDPKQVIFFFHLICQVGFIFCPEYCTMNSLDYWEELNKTSWVCLSKPPEIGLEWALFSFKEKSQFASWSWENLLRSWELMWLHSGFQEGKNIALLLDLSKLIVLQGVSWLKLLIRSLDARHSRTTQFFHFQEGFLISM